MSPFGRYPSTFGGPNPNFPGLSTFPPSREMPPLGGLGSVHDPWRGYVSVRQSQVSCNEKDCHRYYWSYDV